MKLSSPDFQRQESVCNLNIMIDASIRFFSGECQFKHHEKRIFVENELGQMIIADVLMTGLQERSLLPKLLYTNFDHFQTLRNSKASERLKDTRARCARSDTSGEGEVRVRKPMSHYLLNSTKKFLFYWIFVPINLPYGLNNRDIFSPFSHSSSR